MKLRDRAQKWYEQLISLKGEPRDLAFGMAIGVFIGVTPTIPFHSLLTILFCLLLKKNITAAYLGSWLISNPLTIPFFYLSQYRLGTYMLGKSASVNLIQEYSVLSLVRLGGEVMFPLLAGGAIMAGIFAVPTFFLAHKLFVTVRNNRHGHREEHS